VLHQLLEVALDIGFRGIHIPEVGVLVLIQMVFVKYRSRHGRPNVFGGAVDLLHEGPILLNLSGERFSANV
jgi:hypothetical protein